MKFYMNKSNLVAGITLKDNAKNEANNMALHVCQNEDAIIENREDLAKALGTSLDHFVCANQTHSANFYEVGKKDLGHGARHVASAIPQTDALYTTEENIVLCTFTADCVPVFLHHEQVGVIGVIHSGWKGTVQEITRKMLLHLMEEKQCDPTQFHIQIGTALSQKKFEVDKDVYEQFQLLGYATPFIYFNDATGKYHIDNQRVVQKQCELVGVPKENILIDETCTFESPTGFSYRQDKQAGRHLGFIMKK